MEEDHDQLRETRSRGEYSPHVQSAEVAPQSIFSLITPTSHSPPLCYDEERRVH